MLVLFQTAGELTLYPLKLYCKISAQYVLIKNLIEIEEEDDDRHENSLTENVLKLLIH